MIIFIIVVCALCFALWGKTKNLSSEHLFSIGAIFGCIFTYLKMGEWLLWIQWTCLGLCAIYFILSIIKESQENE